MNLPLPARRAALAVTTGALALGLTGTASAAVTTAYDFGGDLSQSFAQDAADVSIMGLGGATDGTFAAGQGYSVPTIGMSPDSYSVAARFKFATVDPNGPAPDGWLRVIDFSGGESDAGLYLHDGKLAWKNADGTLADEGDTALADDVPEQIVVTRSGPVLEVYREGAALARVRARRSRRGRPDQGAGPVRRRRGRRGGRGRDQPPADLLRRRVRR